MLRIIHSRSRRFLIGKAGMRNQLCIKDTTRLIAENDRFDSRRV